MDVIVDYLYKCMQVDTDLSCCSRSVDTKFCTSADTQFLAAAVCPKKCGFCLR